MNYKSEAIGPWCTQPDRYSKSKKFQKIKTSKIKKSKNQKIKKSKNQKIKKSKNQNIKTSKHQNIKTSKNSKTKVKRKDIRVDFASRLHGEPFTHFATLNKLGWCQITSAQFVISHNHVVVVDCECHVARFVYRAIMNKINYIIIFQKRKTKKRNTKTKERQKEKKIRREVKGRHTI